MTQKKKTFVLCDGNRVNAHGFRTLLEGMILNRFESNPVMLYQHNSDDLIGRWENLRVEDNKLLAEAVFDTEDELGAKVAGKVDRGFLRGCSIGIIIDSLTKVKDETVADKTELIEASIVSVPADAGAVVLYDQNRKVLSFNEVVTKLNFNNKQTQTNMEKDEKQIQVLEAKIADKDKKIAELEAKIAEQKAEAEKQRANAIDAFLDAAVKDNKITESEKEGFKKLAATDFETVQNLINQKEVKASASLKDAITNQSQAPAGREDWTYIDWMKKDSEGLKRMKYENPKEFERLQQTLNK